MPATTTGAPFSLNIPSASTDDADLFGLYLKPNMTAININAAHKGTAQTFSALQTFSAGVTVSSGTLILPAGSASAPSIAPSGDSNTGTFYPSADTIAWATGGSERVRVDSSGSVNIGGVASTSGGLLSVAYGITARNIGASVPYLQTYNSNAATNLKTWRLGGGNGGDLQFETVNDAYSSATERMRITSSGAVGIGTSSPTATLSVYNPTASPADTYIDKPVNSLNGSLILRGGPSNNTSGMFIARDGGATGTYNPAGIEISTGGSERMRINSSGQVLIGTNSTPAYFTVGITGNILASKSGAMENVIQSIDNHAYVEINACSSSGTGNAYLTFSTSNVIKWLQALDYSTNRLYIIDQQQNDGVYIAQNATSWTSNSDSRLKDVQGTITNALDKVQQLTGVKFKWKREANNPDAKVRVGLIAQDVQPVLPEAVDDESPDLITDEETGRVSGGLGVRYTELVPLLVNAIKELTARVVALEAQVATA